MSVANEGSSLRERVASFAAREVAPHAATHDRAGTLDRDALRRAGELGLLGLTLPEPAGGAGGGTLDAVILHQELGRHDPGFALAVLAHTILFAHNFFQVASAEQRARILPRMVRGEAIGAMAMTEPGGGTDVLAMQTTARRRGDGYVLRGTKTLITNAPDASVLLVYAKLDDGLTAFLVERGAPGLALGAAIGKMGMRSAPMCEVVLDDCVIPRDNLLGRERAGIVQMMRNLEIERLCLAAISLGIAGRCVDEMLAALPPDPAAVDGQLQRLVAESYARMRAGESFVHEVAARVGPDRWNHAGADAAKLFAAPMAKQVADAALQVRANLAGGTDALLERLFRDAKLLEIGGGTLEAHQRNIVRELTRRARAGSHATVATASRERAGGDRA